MTPVAWLLTYADGRHQAVVLDRARAEQLAVSLHAVMEPLVKLSEAQKAPNA